ncbi:MAG TPA: sulfur transferase domain-containing protein [Pyrinomonadaceae bacterium]|nr:sulfur transferase domain-containing protein [Pyrinomonadaceae bacterium]
MNTVCSRLRLIPTTVFVCLVCAVAVSAQETAGLPKFEQVNDKLFRGGQPHPGALLRLRELGIDTIINLRGKSDRTRAEEAEARALGLNYFNISLPNWGRPQDERVRMILMIINAPQNGRVFVHCKDGVDRTGTIVALHRITREGWKASDALAEAEQRGMRRIQIWMRDYAEDYAHRVENPYAGGNLGDRIGFGMRIVEREAFRARRIGKRILRSIL